MKDVVIIGAGLAGLTCARRLQAGGVDCVVLEAGDGIGGRVRTDRVEGFRLDRGFQVLLTAYPAAKKWLDYERLELKKFSAGARVWCDGKMHRVIQVWRRIGVPTGGRRRRPPRLQTSRRRRGSGRCLAGR